jgi:hypothetical protein
MGITLTTTVNRADDIAITHCDCEFSKFRVPPVISLSDKTGKNNDLGIHRITSSCGTKKFYPIAMDKFMAIPNGHPQKKFPYFIRYGNSIYLTEKIRKVRPVLILSRPLDGFVNENLDIRSGELIPGKSYTIFDGQIIHNGIAFDRGEDFIAVGTDYTGTGVVQLTEPKREMTNDDEYPVSSALANIIIMQILTKEFRLEKEQVSDLINDGRDQTHINESKVTR